jgi:hypothetical protein
MLSVEEEFCEVCTCLFTGEDGIGGVIGKPSFPGITELRAVIEDMGVGSKGSTVRAVGAISGICPELRGVVHCEAMPHGDLKSSSLKLMGSSFHYSMDPWGDPQLSTPSLGLPPPLQESGLSRIGI